MIDITRVLPEKSRIIAAVSGGADSVYLLLRLREMAEKSGFEIIAGHVNHKTRGEASDGDEAFVCALADRLGLACHVDRLELDAEGNQRSEHRLRRLRLGALKAIARRTGAAAIAFGHHRDDLAETFLLNALRGSGPAGLEGMRPVRRLPDGLLLLRPLLDTRRAEIEKWLESKGEKWCIDESNADPAYRRNRLRHDVLPLLESIEPAAIANLANSAEFSGEVYDVYTAEVAALAESCILAESAGVVLFSVVALKRSASAGHAAGLIRHFHQRAVYRFDDQFPAVPNRDTLRKAVRRLYMADRIEAFFNLGQGIVLSLTNRYGLIHPEDGYQEAALSVAAGFPFALAPAGKHARWLLSELQAEDVPIYLPGWSFDYQVSVTSRTFAPKEYAQQAPDERLVYIDMDAVEGDLQLRTLGGEERVSILDGGSKTVRACLQEAGVPPRLREFALGFADDSGIIWIPGVRRSAHGWISENTRRVVEIRQVSKRESR